jgi:hypothetical protein
MPESSAPLDREGKVASNVKAISALAVGLVVGIFGAGVYWSKLQSKIDVAYEYATKSKETNAKTDILLKDNLKHWGNLGSNPKEASRSGPGGGSDNVNTMCDDGFYAVGIQSWSNSGPQCNGCLTGVKVICRPLKTD